MKARYATEITKKTSTEEGHRDKKKFDQLAQFFVLLKSNLTVLGLSFYVLSTGYNSSLTASQKP